MKSVPDLGKGQYVMVKWVDSCGSDGGWHRTKKKHCVPSKIVTVGQVFKRRHTDLTIIMSDSSSGCVDGCITIPASAITSLQKLRVDEN